MSDNHHGRHHDHGGRHDHHHELTPEEELGDTFGVAHEVEELERKSETAARLFDVRRIIGGLFVVYGVIVTTAGFLATDADLEKAEDVNINLWTGLAMLLLGIVFLVWLKLSPTIPPPPAAEADDTEGPGAGPAQGPGPEAEPGAEPKGPAGS